MKRVMAAQARLSEDLHSSAQALNPEAVSLDDLTNEVKALEEWIRVYPRSPKERRKASNKLSYGVEWWPGSGHADL